MKKVAIFTEGQSEQIFIRNLLLKTIDNARLSFECIKLHGDLGVRVPFKYCSPSPDFHFLIINVQNDSRVISAIKERERRLFEKGFAEIIGLRDMYCDEYHKRSPFNINEQVSREFIEGHNRVIQNMTKPETITILFSIMELEGWFLSMYNIFRKINSVLSVEHIETEIGFNLINIDPQKEFYRPSNELAKVLRLAGINYKKSEHDSEMITSPMAIDDFENAFENDRCKSFKDFYQKMEEITDQLNTK